MIARIAARTGEEEELREHNQHVKRVAQDEGETADERDLDQQEGQPDAEEPGQRLP